MSGKMIGVDVGGTFTDLAADLGAEEVLDEHPEPRAGLDTAQLGDLRTREQRVGIREGRRITEPLPTPAPPAGVLGLYGASEDEQRGEGVSRPPRQLAPTRDRSRTTWSTCFWARPWLTWPTKSEIRS